MWSKKTRTNLRKNSAKKLNSLGLEKWQVYYSSQKALLAIHTILGECQKLSCSNPPESFDDTLNVNLTLRNIPNNSSSNSSIVDIGKESLIGTTLRVL